MKNQTLENQSRKISSREALHALLSHAYRQGDSLALWKLPSEEAFHLLVCGDVLEADEFELHELPPGFIVSPFASHNRKFFLKADQYHVFREGEEIADSVELALDPNMINEGVFQQAPLQYYVNAKPTSVATNYHQLVNEALHEIEKGSFEKVVPSRCKTVSLRNGINLIDTFYTLSSKYPEALISIVSSPRFGTWVGATPEILVSVDEHQVFRTVALAGTQPYSDRQNIRAVAWTQKEIEEQAMVSRYIINCFKRIRLREYEEHGPKTVTAGNLLHLRTDYAVDMNAVNFPTLGSVMLKLLHPTSAVCGMPLEAALNFLNAHEGYERELYSGYLGPVNIGNKTSIFVNLRCMKLLGDSATLYAGAGVTVDSIADQEFAETEMKFATLLKILTNEA